MINLVKLACKEIKLGFEYFSRLLNNDSKRNKFYDLNKLYATILSKYKNLKSMQDLDLSRKENFDRLVMLYNEFTSFGVHKLLLKKVVLHRKINFEEFYYMRAKRYISMYFENNKKRHEELNSSLGDVRKENIQLNEDIQKWKKMIFQMV